MWRVLPLIWMCVLTSGNVWAGNIGFLPGDAFFHTRLTADVCQQMVESESIRFPYVRPDWVPGVFCGYYGYMELGLPPDCQKLATLTREVYLDIRTRLPRTLMEINVGEEVKVHETNGLHLFIYNADFDPQQYVVGLRYNEAWVQNLQEFGLPHRGMRLESFDTSPEAFSQDWRDAALVPPLKIKIPRVEESMDAIRRGKAVAKCDGPIQLFVVESNQLKSFLKPYQGMTYFSISSDGVKKYEYRKRQWTVEKWTAAPAGEN